MQRLSWAAWGLSQGQAADWPARADGQADALTWRTIHEQQPGLERAHQRTQDGFYECIFRAQPGGALLQRGSPLHLALARR